MTTAVRVHVNGRYRAQVTQDGREPITVEGSYEGSPNPTGEHTFYISHSPEKGSHSTFEVTETYIGDAAPTPKPEPYVTHGFDPNANPEPKSG